MFRTSKQVADHELRLASLSLAVAELRRDHTASAPAHLLELLKQLETDIEAIRISLRSLHGKVAYQQRGATPAGGRADVEIPSDQEFQSLLELQRQFTGSN